MVSVRRIEFAVSTMGGTNRIDYPSYRSVRRLELQIHELLFNLVIFLIDNKVSVIKKCSLACDCVTQSTHFQSKRHKSTPNIPLYTKVVKTVLVPQNGRNPALHLVQGNSCTCMTYIAKYSTVTPPPPIPTLLPGHKDKLEC